MDEYTEKLNVLFNSKFHDAPNRSGGVFDLFDRWFKMFRLDGNGLLLGEQNDGIKEWFKNKYPEITDIATADLENADYIWDMTITPILPSTFNWIFCQATLEHVISPFLAIRNMKDLLLPNGRLFLHAASIDFKYHAHPVDCNRLFRDALIGFADRLNLEIEDILWTKRHWFVVYKKQVPVWESTTNYKHQRVATLV